jgi:hypothetical protein
MCLNRKLLVWTTSELFNKLKLEAEKKNISFSELVRNKLDNNPPATQLEIMARDFVKEYKKLKKENRKVK